MHCCTLESAVHVSEETLDEECSLYMMNQTQFPLHRNLENPLAKLLSYGDDMHFIPIDDEEMVPEGRSS
ncbi:hypothetical protein Ahia01_000867800 [Argonauta hians]